MSLKQPSPTPIGKTVQSIVGVQDENRIEICFTDGSSIVLNDMSDANFSYVLPFVSNEDVVAQCSVPVVVTELETPEREDIDRERWPDRNPTVLWTHDPTDETV